MNYANSTIDILNKTFCLNIQENQIHQSIFDFIDSLDIIEFICVLENHYQIQIHDNDLDHIDSIQDFLSLIENKLRMEK